MKKKHIISLTVILSCLTALIAAGGYYIKELYYSQNAEDLAFLSGSYKTELHHLDLRHKLIDRRVPNFCRVLEGTHFIDNIWSIDVAENQLARISDLSCFGNLKELNLSYNAFPRIPDMGALGALETLNMTKNHIREVGNMALRFPKLTTLNLGYNGVVSLNMEFLPKSLSTLELQHNNIMEIRGAKSLENLITLKLEYNNLETADVSDVIKLPKLSSLTLAENHIDDAIVKFWNEKTKKAAGITE